MKAILNSESVNAYIDLHKQMKLPFKLSLSTYTARITSNYCDIHFMKSEQPNRVFSAFNSLKSEVVKTKIKPINAGKLSYFAENFGFDNFYTDYIFNIDIKSAYATILKNDGLISEKTFTFISSLPKQERLACVGMLAGKKNIFTINEQGETVTDETIISPTSDYFFHCVKRTAEIMKGAAKYLGNAFLFSWVDGIYFLENEKAGTNAGNILKEYFEKLNLKTSFEKLNSFEVEAKKDFYKVSYLKEDKKKILNVPKKDSLTIKKISEHLLTKTY
jgi:hypothetical protein